MHRAPQAAAESEEFIMAVTVLTSDNFETEALQAKQPVLIDFFATWCGPCKMLSPVVDQIADETGVSGVDIIRKRINRGCKALAEIWPDFSTQ